MVTNRIYDIAFVGLKPGLHEFNYQINDSFFLEFGEQDFTNCETDIKVTLEKHTGLIQLKFEIGGNIDVGCDRCGNPLKKVLWDEFSMIIKLVDNPDEMNIQEEDPDICYIARTESHLHISDWIYEFVTLSIPNQKTCTVEEFGSDLCNKDVLAKLQQMEEAIKKEANPLWKGLDIFKEKEN